MANPSYTYTLTNGTTADADQVQQNFDDILNGVTDGTKDLSIAALTVAGTLTANGNVTLGNATADDITVTGSLASSIPIKTDASFDIGSTSLGLRRAYFGGNSNRVGIGASSSTSATWNLTLPTTAGTSGYVLQTDGSGNTSWFDLDTNYAELDISSSGAFSAAQPVLRIFRSKQGVVLAFPDLAHTSGSTAASASGFIPSGYRPPHTIINTYSISSADALRILIATDGTITFSYFNWAGSGTSRSSTSSGSCSWVIDA